MSTHTPEAVDSSEIIRQADLDAIAKREEILRAMTPGERFLIGAELYELGISLMIAGIRNQRPEATEEEVQAELRKRLLPEKLREEYEAFLKERKA